MSLELGGGQGPKNAEGVQGQSWQNSKMALERKRSCPLTVRVEGVCSSAGDCWKGLRIRSTLKHLWNSEAVRVQRMLKVSEVGVGKTLRYFQSGKQVIP